MRKELLNLLSLNQSFAEHELHLKYKIAFLNSVFLMAAVVAFGMGFYRWQHSPLMGAIDFAFFAVSIAVLYYLKRNKGKVERVGSLAILLCFLLFVAIYLLAPYNTMRLSLFFLLSAAAFYLKGRRIGLRWLLFILFTIVSLHVWRGSDTGYSHIDIITTCLYLIALFVIFWNYESIREDQLRREREHQLQSWIDERWRLALESAGDAIWDWDLQTNRFATSKSYAEMLGFEEGEIGETPDHLEKILHPEEKQHAMDYLAGYLNGDSSGQYHSEHRLRCKDGSYKWILCRGRVMRRDENGRPSRMFGTHVDISQQKLIESALKDSEKRLHLAMESAQMGAWDYDFRTQKLYWSPEIFRLFGVTQCEPTLTMLHQHMPEEDVRLIMSEMDRSVAEHLPYHVEFRIGVPGDYRWVEDRGEVIYSEQGEPLRVIGTAQDITHRKMQEKQLERIAHYDALTGVPNRVLLADRLSQALARAKREKELMAVCYLDLDGFKSVNDTFGHDAGDRVLVEITRRIKEAIREDDTIARLGGDEFVVLLVGLEAPEECVGSLHRLLDSISAVIDVKGKPVCISASIGVALYPEDDEAPDILLRHADQAMYIAKQSGKNRYHLFDAANDQRARSHHELLQQIRHGLAHGEFELYYQPKVEMRSRRMVGAEALIRWHHPQRGLLLPGEYLHMIENTELEIELGDWVVVAAMAQLCKWREAGHEIDISINISAYHLQSPDFVQKLQRSMTQWCPEKCEHCLQIEVLETAALEDIAKVSAIIKTCREIGVGFALDDFGTGYSSLTYLSNLDVDTLKIDQSFVRDMLEEKGDHAIVQGIISLAKAFERDVVAEGVENEAHAQALIEMGCEIGQGYGLARPMPASELVQWRSG